MKCKLPKCLGENCPYEQCVEDIVKPKAVKRPYVDRKDYMKKYYEEHREELLAKAKKKNMMKKAGKFI